jgi:hypothetical protein
MRSFQYNRDFIGIDLAGRQEVIISFRQDEELY